MAKHEVGVMTNLFNNYRLVMRTFLLAWRAYVTRKTGGKMAKFICILLCILALISCDSNINYVNQGVAFAEDGNYDKAIESYQKALDVNPDNAEVYSKMGYALEEKYNNGKVIGNYDKETYRKAIECYQKAIEINPNYAYVYKKLGNIYIKQFNGYDKALECYQKLLELNPKDAYAYSQMGYIYSSMKYFTKATRYYQKAIEIDPDNDASAYYNLGIINKEKKITAADNFYQAGLIYLKQDHRQYVLKTIEKMEEYELDSELIRKLKNKLYE